MNVDNPRQRSAEAWLLSFDNELNAAVGGRELQHIAHAPTTFTIPFCPVYVDQVLIWSDRLLPVIDLASWSSDGRQFCRSDLIGIVAYLEHDTHTPSYAGLRIRSAPKRLQVYDHQACALPQNMLRWRSITTSCFKYRNGKPVPILDLARVFSNSLQAETRQATLRMGNVQMNPQV